MEDNFYIQIKKLISNVNLKKINYKLIKTNIGTLINVYGKLKKCWDRIKKFDIKYNVTNAKDENYNYILDILNDNFLSSSDPIKQIISNCKYIHYLSYSNIHFYWIDDNDKKDLNNKKYLLSLDMFKIALGINLYKFEETDNVKRCIIWIPIDKKRDFTHDIINGENLNKSQDRFEAFVASGVTFGTNPKITIITRYEEVEKLLIHELIHNYGMDGSQFHNQLDKILCKYKKVKNKGNYHYEYSIYESYTEMLSTYFYLLFTNIKLDLSEKSKELKNKLMAQILVEIFYSYNLICNLIKLNGYRTYEDFLLKKTFEGKICKYEYYYIKGLMYNNWELKFGNNLDDFINLYSSIIEMIKNINSIDEPILKEIYLNYVKQKNYKYQIH